MRLYRLLKKPIVTEKTSNMSLQKNVYVFEVSLDATKIDIKKFNLIQIGKIFSFFAIILSTFLILYLQFSLVGSDIIEGVQQRYFIAYSLLLLSFIPNIAKLKRTFLNGIVFVTYFPLVTYIIYFFTQIF